MGQIKRKQIKCRLTSSSSTSSLVKVVKTKLIHKSITLFIQHTYYEVIAEESVTFINKMKWSARNYIKSATASSLTLSESLHIWLSRLPWTC